MGKGGTCPLEMLKSVFLLQMLSKTSVYEVFMHNFEKMSSVSGGFAKELPLHPAVGLPSFNPPHCLPLEKNPSGAHDNSLTESLLVKNAKEYEVKYSDKFRNISRESVMGANILDMASADGELREEILIIWSGNKPP